MEGKNIPPFITLSAAMIACIVCIIRRVTLYSTLKVVLLVMVLFYIIGRIVQKVVVKINADAEEAALQRQREEQELAAKELEAKELEKKEKADGATEEEGQESNTVAEEGNSN